MTQSRRTIEQLLKQGSLPLAHADTAAAHLNVYPSKRTWLDFFDKALLIIGAVALVLSLVFFIAYNWLYMGKMGKFALVEGALVITIALYVGLSFKKRFKLIRQLLLLIASVITGSLLALFGQVYQTGADTWQLFFGWAVLILPWVIIARFPTLWLLWLGLINATVLQYIQAAPFITDDYFYVLRIAALAVINTLMLGLWLLSLHRVTERRVPEQSGLHWSTYVVGLLSTYFITHLGFIYVISDSGAMTALMTLLLWACWCVFMYWRFYQRQVDVLMLTLLCFSIIVVVMFWAGKFLLNDFDAGGFFILALLLIAMSSAAVVWLRGVASADNISSTNHKSDLPDRGAEHE